MVLVEPHLIASVLLVQECKPYKCIMMSFVLMKNIDVLSVFETDVKSSGV
jgi:hypothetical protein